MKTFKIEIVGKFPKNKNIPEILKKPLRTFLIDADSKIDAIEKTKKEMLKTTYRRFFPELNDRNDELWYTSWSVQQVFPDNFVYENGKKYLTDWNEKEVLKMSENYISSKSFRKLEIVVNEK